MLTIYLFIIVLNTLVLTAYIVITITACLLKRQCKLEEFVGVGVGDKLMVWNIVFCTRFSIAQKEKTTYCTGEDYFLSTHNVCLYIFRVGCMQKNSFTIWNIELKYIYFVFIIFCCCCLIVLSFCYFWLN